MPHFHDKFRCEFFSPLFMSSVTWQDDLEMGRNGEGHEGQLLCSLSCCVEIKLIYVSNDEMNSTPNSSS